MKIATCVEVVVDVAVAVDVDVGDAVGVEVAVGAGVAVGDRKVGGNPVLVGVAVLVGIGVDVAVLVGVNDVSSVGAGVSVSKLGESNDVARLFIDEAITVGVSVGGGEGGRILHARKTNTPRAIAPTATGNGCRLFEQVTTTAAAPSPGGIAARSISCRASADAD